MGLGLTAQEQARGWREGGVGSGSDQFGMPGGPESFSEPRTEPTVQAPGHLYVQTRGPVGPHSRILGSCTKSA